jgi:hypothetical protein
MKTAATLLIVLLWWVLTNCAFAQFPGGIGQDPQCADRLMALVSPTYPQFRN